MFDLRELVTLIAIIDEGSFEAAAKVLHVTTGAVSQRIKSLENRLGQPLLIRSNPLCLTAPGEDVMQLARKVKLLQDEALLSIAGADNTSGQALPIAVNHDSLTCWFSGVLTCFTQQPQMPLLDIRASDNVSTNQLLKSGAVVAAITALDHSVPGCRLHKLGALEYFAVCSKSTYQQCFATGFSFDKLAAVPVVLFDHDDHLDEQLFKLHQCAVADLQRHYIPDSREQLKAILQGAGWGLIPRQLLEEFDHPELNYLDCEVLHVDLYWKVWDIASARIQQLERQVIAIAQQQLYQSRGC